MSSANDELLQQLRATFQVEAAEQLQALSDALIRLEQGGPAPGDAIETAFRAVHSLKGAARAVEFAQIELLCQAVEEVFARWKRQRTVPEAKALNTLHASLDAMAALLANPAGAGGAAIAQAASARRLLQQLAAQFPGPGASPATVSPAAPRLATAAAAAAVSTPAAAPAPVRGESVRVPTVALEAQLLCAEEMLAAKLGARQRAADLSELSTRLDAWQRAWTDVGADARILRQSGLGAGEAAAQARLRRVLEFLDTGLSMLRSMEAGAATAWRAAEQDRHAVDKLVEDLLENAKTLLLLPFSTISAAFPRLVRDLCQEQGKDVDFEIAGSDVRIEKRVLEEMKDPLIHLLRNAVDHGVEPPAARARAGKPPRASVALTVSQVDGNKVQIVLADDGAGVDSAAVAASALGHGLITPAEAADLSPAQAQGLIFSSAVSTSATVTRVSGRGLGLAIAREKVEALGGRIAVDSAAGRGTSFRIVLPAARATFRGILVESGGQLLVAPTAQVERVARVAAGDIHAVEGRETLSLEGHALPLLPLSHLLGLAVPHRPDDTHSVLFLVIGQGEHRIALSVDAVLHEQEVLVKPLRKPLVRVRNVAGATVLGSGRVVPVLSVPDLLRSARGAPAPVRPAAPPAAAEAPARPVVLVAEDSITSRMLLRGILESAGYEVKTAADGMEAYALLRAGNFDVLVSDVEMPRLDGFALTRRVRGDARLAGLPVVLVTALATREDREHGADAGADAYIVKGGFDQDDLLETVARLVGRR